MLLKKELHYIFKREVAKLPSGKILVLSPSWDKKSYFASQPPYRKDMSKLNKVKPKNSFKTHYIESLGTMAIRVVEFSNGGYKIWKIFA